MKGRHLCALLLLGLLYAYTLPAAFAPAAASGWPKVLCALSGTGLVLLALWLAGRVSESGFKPLGGKK